jgi:quinol monooxygenase YgiN
LRRGFGKFAEKWLLEDNEVIVIDVGEASMYSSIIQVAVQDFDQWREVFDQALDFRRSMGCIGERVFQDLNDPHKLLIILDWESSEDAQAHAQSPELRQNMQRAGVMGAPTLMMAMDVTGKY